MSCFEILMLMSFGAAWPISIIKTLRTKQCSGKSPLFMVIILFGYLCGILHKIFYAYDFVIFLYGINMIMVGVDFLLYLKYRK